MAEHARAFCLDFDVTVPAELIARSLPDQDRDLLATGTEREAVASGAVRAPGHAPLALLFDQSHSGEAGLATWLPVLDLLATGLEARGVPFEVLGFTTTHYRDNPASRRWIAQGRPSEPGRLTPLLHVVYKDFAQSWDGSPQDRQVGPRTCLARMMRREYMRENVDGEAVDWAVGRLSRGTTQARPPGDGTAGRLVILSEASPVDEATMRANGNDFLRIDLDRALEVAGRRGVAVTGLCIGREADAAFHYRDHVMIGRRGSATDLVVRLLGRLGFLAEGEMTTSS